MRKTPLKMHPLQECIQSFHRSPVYQCKKQLRGEEGKLKKIGRNKLIIKQTPLPVINPIKNKENEHPNFPKRHMQHQSSEVLLMRPNAKNLSFGQPKIINMEQRLSRMVASQKDLNQQNQSEKIKEAVLKKQFFIRDRRMLPQRNCMSASSKKEPKEAPIGVKEFRKALRLRRSKELKEEEMRQLAPYQQAQRIAEEARPFTTPNASRHPVRSASLQDFLNQWKNTNRNE